MSYLDEINKTFSAIGTAPFNSLTLPFVSYRDSLRGNIRRYPMNEVFDDNYHEPAVQVALIAMLEKSTCPLVQAYKQTVQACYVAQNLEELEMREESV